MSKISIIVPVYNVEKYLNKCIDSVLMQKFKDIELILVNDGSIDSSGEICDLYAKQDTRVKVIHKENSGAADSRNIGLQYATSDYIMFLDSDDFWMEDCLEEIALFCEQNNDIVFLTRTNYYDKNKTIDKNFQVLDRSKIKNKSKEEVFKYFSQLSKFPVSACTKLIRKSILVDNNIFFKKGILCEDIEWSTRLILVSNKFDVCNKEFYVYRKGREDSVTNSITEKNIEHLFNTIDEWYRKHKNDEIDKKLSKYLMGIYAYQYTILITLLQSVDSLKNSRIKNDILDIKDILNYSSNKKTKLVRAVSKVIGINNTMKILYLYLKLR